MCPGWFSNYCSKMLIQKEHELLNHTSKTLIHSRKAMETEKPLEREMRITSTSQAAKTANFDLHAEPLLVHHRPKTPLKAPFTVPGALRVKYIPTDRQNVSMRWDFSGLSVCYRRMWTEEADDDLLDLGSAGSRGENLINSGVIPLGRKLVNAWKTSRHIQRIMKSLPSVFFPLLLPIPNESVPEEPNVNQVGFFVGGPKSQSEGGHGLER